MLYKRYPKTDRGRLRAITVAVNASSIKLHTVKLPLILDAEAGFFMSWFTNQLPRFKQNGVIRFSGHMREKSDKIIRRLWLEIELQLKGVPESERSIYAENWGMNFIDVRYKRVDLEQEDKPEDESIPFYPFLLPGNGSAASYGSRPVIPLYKS